MKNKTFEKMLMSAVFALTLAGCGSNASTTTEKASSNPSISDTTKPASTFDTSKNIVCYTRDTTSGTRDGFFTKIGLSKNKASNDGLVAGVVEASSNGNMIQSIINDTYGIGYISLASLKDSGVKGLTYENVEPSEANVLNGTYSLTRNFNYVYRNDYDSTSKVKQIVEAFVAYTTTIEGKSIIKQKDGILSIANTDVSWNDIKANYPICNEDNSSITIRIGGSTSCEKIATALTTAFSPLCGNFIASHNHTGSGDAYKHTQGAQKDDSGALDIGFLSRELEDSEPAVEGTYGKICTDAIVAVVNEANPLTKTDADTLKAVYVGEKTLWKDIIA